MKNANKNAVVIGQYSNGKTRKPRRFSLFVFYHKASQMNNFTKKFLSAGELKQIETEEKMLEEILSSKPTYKQLGFVAPFMAQLSLPYRSVKGTNYRKEHGNLLLEITAPSMVGIPYGSAARLGMIYLVTLIAKTPQTEKYVKKNYLVANNFSDFIRHIGGSCTGGKRGNITRIKDQMKRILASNICFCDRQVSAMDQIHISDAFRMFDANEPDEPKAADYMALPAKKDKAGITISFSESFLKSLKIHPPIPIDMRVIRQIQNSSQAIDIYTWLRCRFYNKSKEQLRKPLVIPWQKLIAQFGTKTARDIDFSRNYVRQLERVLKWYPIADFEAHPKSLTLVLRPDARERMDLKPWREPFPV